MSKINRMTIVANIIAVAVLVSGVSFTACQKDNNSTDQSLERELINLNTSIGERLSYDKTQKGWFQDAAVAVGKACAVAGADLAGAATAVKAVAVVAVAVGATAPPAGGAIAVGAAVVGGVGASYVAGSKMLAVAPPNKPEENSSIWDYGNIGKLHNELLNELAYSALISTDEINAYLVKSMEIHENNDIEILTCEAWLNKMQIIRDASVKYVKEDFNYKNMLMSYYAHGLISPAVHTVLMSFFEVYTAIKDMKELGEVVSSYVEYVEHSAFLSVEDKDALLTALAVADSSPRFWLPIMLILPE